MLSFCDSFRTSAAVVSCFLHRLSADGVTSPDKGIYAYGRK